MRCYQSCQECPRRHRETDPENDCDVGDFEYYLTVRSVDYAAARLGYGWPVVRSNGQHQEIIKDELEYAQEMRR